MASAFVCVDKKKKEGKNYNSQSTSRFFIGDGTNGIVLFTQFAHIPVNR